MFRITMLSITLLAVLFAVGCDEPLKDDSRFRVDPAMLDKAMNEGFAVPEAAEVDLVEAMAASRSEYYTNLEALQRFYAARGMSMKSRWAQKELESVGKVAQYRYLTPAESTFADFMGVLMRMDMYAVIPE